MDRQELLRLTAALDAALPSLRAKDVTTVALSFARLGWKPSLTLGAMVRFALDRLGEFAPGSLVWFLWSLGRLRYATPAVQRLLSAAAGRVVLQLSEDRGSFTADQLCTVCWVLGRCSFRGVHAMNQLAAALVAHPGRGELWPSLVSNAVWAFARLGRPNEELASWAAGMLQTTADKAAPQALANTAWGLWRMGARQRACHARLPSFCVLNNRYRCRSCLMALGRSSFRMLAGCTVLDRAQLLSSCSTYQYQTGETDTAIAARPRLRAPSIAGAVQRHRRRCLAPPGRLQAPGAEQPAVCAGQVGRPPAARVPGGSGVAAGQQRRCDGRLRRRCAGQQHLGGRAVRLLYRRDCAVPAL